MHICSKGANCLVLLWFKRDLYDNVVFARGLDKSLASVAKEEAKEVEHMQTH